MLEGFRRSRQPQTYSSLTSRNRRTPPHSQPGDLDVWDYDFDIGPKKSISAGADQTDGVVRIESIGSIASAVSATKSTTKITVKEDENANTRQPRAVRKPTFRDVTNTASKQTTGARKKESAKPTVVVSVQSKLPTERVTDLKQRNIQPPTVEIQVVKPDQGKNKSRILPLPDITVLKMDSMDTVIIPTQPSTQDQSHATKEDTNVHDQTTSPHVAVAKTNIVTPSELTEQTQASLLSVNVTPAWLQGADLMDRYMRERQDSVLLALNKMEHSLGAEDSSALVNFPELESDVYSASDLRAINTLNGDGGMSIGTSVDNDMIQDHVNTKTISFTPDTELQKPQLPFVSVEFAARPKPKSTRRTASAPHPNKSNTNATRDQIQDDIIDEEVYTPCPSTHIFSEKSQTPSCARKLLFTGTEPVSPDNKVRRTQKRNAKEPQSNTQFTTATVKKPRLSSTLTGELEETLPTMIADFAAIGSTYNITSLFKQLRIPRKEGKILVRRNIQLPATIDLDEIVN